MKQAVHQRRGSYGSPDERQIMKCISSPALDNVEIASYVEGEADEATVAHIKQCPFCSERARQWTLLQNRLREQFYRVNCPTPMELGDYHLGFLSDSQKLGIPQHVRECLLCRQEVAILENFLSTLAPESNLLGAAKVRIARLMGAQAENGLAQALRGEAKGPLTFEADGFVIVLDIQPAAEGSFNILGQVAADDQEKWTGALVEFRQGDELQLSTTVDDLGAFRSDGMESGSKELRIIPKDGSLILVSNFKL
jgi:hypothetical protein